MLLAALSLTLNGPLASITAQGVPTEPTATPNADLAPMPVQGTAVAPTPMPVPEVLATEARAPEYAPGVVLVGVSSTGNKGGASPIDVMLAQVGGVRAEKLYTMGSDGAAARGESAGATVVYRATLPQGADVLAAVETLQKGGVVFAEPDYLARAIPVERGQGNPERGQVVAATPNDPLYADQWGLTKIKAATAWNVVTGTPGTVIAIIDSGIDRQHPDLASRLWVNPGEIPNNGIDDDNNGYVDDVHGWNFVAKSNDVADVNGHGTQVAGVAAAAGNNGVGIAGVCWDCRIMVVKAMQASGVANYSDIAAAVNYAVAKGARVINLSLGGYADSTALRTAIQTAAGSAVIVAGAGNDSTANRFYPAAYANVLGVAATTVTNTKVGFSNYGDWVSLAAPGEAITTTFLGSDYGPGSGTSLASPFVAGLAGLIRSQRSAWSPALVRLQLLQTASALGGGGLGRGLPDASKAVQDPQPLLNLTSYTINGDANGRPTAGDAVAVVVNVSNQWLDAADVQATLSTTSTYATIGAGSASVGDIASGDVKASGVLTFRVASNAGYGRAIPLTVRLTANGGSYVRSFPIAVTTRSSEEPVCGTIVNEDDLSQTELLWTSDKTYVATCDINVPAGYTLTIQPGTRVQFAGNYAFNIGGTLIADGDGSAPIRFEAKMAGAGWTGLYYRETAADALVTNQGVYLGGNILRGVQIRGATSGIRCEATTLFLSQVTTDGGGMDCTTEAGSSAWLIDSSIGGAVVINGQAVVSNTLLSDNLSVSGTALVQKSKVGLPIVQVAAGAQHTCALTSGGGVKCWGSNGIGQQAVTGLSSGVVAIAASNNHTCAVTSGGGVKCWGWNASGQLGNGGTENASTPQDVTGLSSGVVAIAAGYNHTCAVTSGGGVKCWGAKYFGQLGNGGTTDASMPQDVAGLSSGVVAIAAGESHTCALTSVGGVKCWGWNLYGQLGKGGTEYASTLQDVTGLSSGVVAIAADEHTCAVTSGGGVKCWGSNSFGQLGNGGTTNASTPQAVTGLSSGVAAIAAGSYHTCAVTNAGRVKCWGYNGQGQLGNGGTVKVSVGADAVVADNTLIGGGITAGDRAVLNNNTLSDGGITVGANSEVTGNTVEGASGAGLSASTAVTATSNRFVNSGAGIVASTGLISGNLIANNAGVGVQFGAATVVSNTIIGNRGNAMLVQGGTPLLVSGNNIDGNKGLYDLYADVPSGVFVSAQNNWWGITTTSAIRARIFDWYRDSTKATVTFSPKLNVPSTDAPAYVRRVSVLPDTTVGIQTATFDVEFSREVLTETLPTLTASGPAEFTLPAPREISGTHALFDAEITALWPRGVYTLTVADAVGADGIKIAPNSDYRFTVDYAGFVSDQTPPSTPQVTALSDGTLTKLTLRWVTSDTESGVTHYRYAVGTTPGGTDVVNWTTIVAPSSRSSSNEFSIVRTGLNLMRGQTYYVSAQARNAGGLWSDPGQSNQVVGGVVTVLPTATPTITPTRTRTSTPGPGTPTATPDLLKLKVFVPAAWR